MAKLQDDCGGYKPTPKSKNQLEWLYGKDKKDVLKKSTQKKAIEKKAFYFNRGAFFGGTLITTIYTLLNDKDHVVLEMRPANLFRKMKRYEFIMPITEMERITRFIASIQDWKTQYKNERRILDGYGWSLEYHFGDMGFQTQGYMCFPENYKEKISELQTIIEEFCQKYDPDGYDMGDREERINL